MDIKKFDFPKFDAVSIAFPVLETDKDLLDEAIKRGFYNGNTPYNSLFSRLFFSGGSLNFKKDINSEFKKRATLYLKTLMGSYAPKHQEKEAICAMLLSELVEVGKEEENDNMDSG